jgi:hypothetical protein
MAGSEHGFFALDAGKGSRFFMGLENTFFAVNVMILPMPASRKAEKTDL